MKKQKLYKKIEEDFSKNLFDSFYINVSEPDGFIDYLRGQQVATVCLDSVLKELELSGRQRRQYDNLRGSIQKGFKKFIVKWNDAQNKSIELLIITPPSV